MATITPANGTGAPSVSAVNDADASAAIDAGSAVLAWWRCGTALPAFPADFYEGYRGTCLVCIILTAGRAA